METLWIVFTIQLQYHYASTHPSLFWESQLPLVGLVQSKFCRHPTAFHPSDSPSSSTEGPLTSKVNASRNSKEQSARFLLVVYLGNDGKSKLVIAASLSQFQSNQRKWHHFLQLGFRATVDGVKAFITILVKHIYIYMPVLITLHNWTFSEFFMPFHPCPY